MSQVLITGFLPFDGEKINPSEILSRDIARENSWDHLVLPVSYLRAQESLALHKGKYKYLIHLGQAGGRSQIQVERFAINWIESSIPDEDGVNIGPQKIHEAGSDIIHSSWEIDIPTLKKFNLGVSISAGGYVCNHTYYHSLRDNPHSQVIFIHVPYCAEQVEGQKREGAMSLSDMKDQLIAYFKELGI